MSTKLSQATRFRCWEKYIGNFSRGKCFCCGDQEITFYNYTGGHIIHESKGGDNDVKNIRPICDACNKGTQSGDMREFQEKKHNKSTIRESQDEKWKLPDISSSIMEDKVLIAKDKIVNTDSSITLDLILDENAFSMFMRNVDQHPDSKFYIRKDGINYLICKSPFSD